MRRAFCLALATAGVFACSGTPTDSTRASSLELTPSTATVRTGGTLPLAVQARDAGGGSVAVGTVFWSSSDTAIATVSSSGLVTARKAGAVKIAASANGTSGLASITVSDRDVASVQVVPAALSLRAGATGPLEARTLDAQGGVLAGRVVAWTTSNSAVATVDAQGIVTARAVGNASVTATSESKSASAAITVTAVPVATVTLTPSPDTLTAGATQQLTVSTRDAGGALLTGRVVTFAAADTRVATVSSGGLVTAVAPGSTTITATSEGRSGTATIVVLARPVASVNVTPPNNSVIVGGSVQLAAQLTDAQGTVLSGRQVTWVSSSGSVASVDANGRVSALAPGNATITATSEGRSGSASVTVSAVPVASVDVAPDAAAISTGATVQLSATVRSASGAVLSGRTVTWRSGAASVASVTSGGLVTGLTAGTAVVIAESEGVTGSATITVRVPRVASVTVTPATASIQTGASQQLVATLKDDAGNTLTNRTIVWSSSSEAIAFVTSSGVVIGFLPGTATITATAEGVSGTARITVR